MPFSEHLPISGSWWIDGTISILVLLILLYLARSTVHEIIRGLSRSLCSSLRLAARALSLWSEQLHRNGRRNALLIIEEHQERLTTRELEQLRKEVQSSLKRYPALRDAINHNIQRIEGEYEAGPAQPEPPSAWGELITSVTGIKENSDPALRDTLESIRETIDSASRKLTQQHQTHLRAAERGLGRLEPRWSQATEQLERLNTLLGGLQERLDGTSRRLRRFETIHNQRHSLNARFHGWLTINCLIGAFLVGVAVLIGLVNFHLVLAPLEEVVGQHATTGPFQTAPLMALTLTLAQIALAIVVSDSAQLSRLIAPIGRLSPLRRRISLGLASTLLLLLAMSEASLAFLRDSIQVESEWLMRELSDGVRAGEPDLRWAPSLAQMGMGFVLPLSFIALVPAVESFFQTFRVGFLLASAAVIRVLATFSRLLANLTASLGHLLNFAYDLLIVVPLSIERRFRRKEPGLDTGSEH